MNVREFEQKMENLIMLDQQANKILAVKTKRLNKKLQFIADSIQKFNEAKREKQNELNKNEAFNEELETKLIELTATEIKLKQQISRLEKMNIDVPSNQSKTISPKDQEIYTKDAFKLKLLNNCTKMRFHESTSNGIITIAGYTNTGHELKTFEEKIPQDSKAKEKIEATLWENMKLASNHISEWDALFSDESETHQNTI